MAFSFAPILDTMVYTFYLSTTVFILRFGLILTTSTKVSNSGKPKSGIDEAYKGLWLRDIINKFPLWYLALIVVCYLLTIQSVTPHH